MRITGWLLAGVIAHASLHANVVRDVRSITQSSVTDKLTIAKVSHSANLVAYMNQGIGTLDASATLREIDSGEIRCRWDSQGAPRYYTFSPDGLILLVYISTVRSRSTSDRLFSLGSNRQYVPYIYNASTCAPIRDLLLDKGNYSGL